MMRSRYFVAIGTAALVVGGSAYSYEVQTHANLTRHAYDRSILADPVSSPLLAFGVEDQAEARFVTRPIDDTWPLEDLESVRTTPREVVALGAHQEDIPLLAGRFLNHFYDPQQGGIGLTAPVFGSGLPSPDWVLEDQGQINAQQDSLRDALEFHRLALTLAQSSERDTNLTRLLEILGRSVHHLQDMSQPAHVRNDAHQPGDFDNYEGYTDSLFGIGGAQRIPRDSPYPNGAVAVDLETFDEARKFWSNGGKGIAEFTTNNFVSKDTNFRGSPGSLSVDTQHALPAPAGTNSTTLGALGINSQLPPSTPVLFAQTQVHDEYFDQVWLNDRASTWSLFLPDVANLAMQPILTQNRLNFAKNYEFLLPRAIAYSAGLINYYFRGRLQLEDLSTSGGVTTITIRNASAPDFALGAGLPGFRLFYEALDGQRREINVEELDDPGTELQFDATRRLSFTPPADVDWRKDSQYLLMFDGAIGTETGIAALAFGSAGAGFGIVPFYVPDDGDFGVRRLRWNDGNWSVAPAADLEAGSIDWKGHKHEDVLTWGFGNRYHYSSGGGPVYMGGRVLTPGPGASGTIIGASIRYIDGLRVLNVAIQGWDDIRIYSRTFAQHYDNEESWSSVNPLGWRLVYSGTHGARYTGFFFNASGTEGQYLTRNTSTNGPERRVKISLSDYTAAAVEFPARATVTRTSRSTRSTQLALEFHSGMCFVSPGYPNGVIQPGGVSDGCHRIAFDGSENRLFQDTVTEQYADRTLFCVDYRGDQEVFCELQPPPSPTYSNVVHYVIEEEYRESNDGASCGTFRRDMQYVQTIDRQDNQARIMRIGNLAIPWTESSRTDTSVTPWGGAFRTPEHWSGSYTSRSTVTRRTTRLIQFDARHDFALYEESLDEGLTEYEGAYTNTGGLPSNLSQSSVESERVVMRLGADSQVLVETTDSDSVDTPGTTTPTLLPYDGLHDCLPRAPTDQSSSTTFLDPAAASSIFSNQYGNGVYAIDRFGRLALSQRITIPGSSGQSSYRSVLTGGDLPTLIPGTPTSEGYPYSIQLIR